MTNLITTEQNLRYFSGFSGSVGILIVHGNASSLIIDGRYAEQAKHEVKKGIKIIEATLGATLWETAVKLLKKLNAVSVGFEDDRMDVATFNKLKRDLPNVTFHSISREIRDKRCVKDKHEVDLIRKAALIADLSYDCVIRIIKQGMTEKDISAHLDYLMKTFKADFPAFETLVSSGKLSAYPHGKPTDKKVNKGDIVVMDFGARYKGYNSDITRMASIGNPSVRQQNIFDAVLVAQEAAISIIRDGIKASQVDEAARKVLKKEKLEKYFKHGTGHGVGLSVHEAPRVSGASKDILREGMVITVEPGVYLPGFGGFRIEDMVLVKKGGYEVITKSPKKLVKL